MRIMRHLGFALILFGISGAVAQEPNPAPKTKLKDEMRMPWKRSDENFLRLWLVVGLVAGILFTPARRYLKSPWLWAGAAIAVLPPSGDISSLSALRFCCRSSLRL